jgi:hypothetical protein
VCDRNSEKASPIFRSWSLRFSCTLLPQ